MNSEPHRVLPLNEPLALRCEQQLRERELAMGRPGAPPLMERAGWGAARLARALAPGARHVALLCGPGNNGGDGLIAARHLHQQGLQVSVHLIGGSPRTEANRHALAQAQGCGIACSLDLQIAPRADLVIDAMLGLGLRRPLQGEFQKAAALLAQHSGLRLALDLPSGLDANTGADWGAAPCDHTLSFLALSPGLFTGAGRQLGGTVWLDGLTDGTEPPWAHPPAAWLRGAEALTPWPEQGARGRWPHAGHKGTQGDVCILAGAMPGAAQLAAQAALEAGAGRVYVQGLAALNAVELMAAPAELPWLHNVFVAGCGWSEAQEERLANVLHQAKQLVLDAGALNAIAQSSALQRLLAARSSCAQETVITPHPLEAARLLGMDTSSLQADRLASAQLLADRLNCTVILKGSGSVVASPGQVPSLNSTGHAALASPGTGDVLAGWLAGLWTQSKKLAPHELAVLAVAWHGAAADLAPLGGGPLIASRLIQAMSTLHPHRACRLAPTTR